MSNLINAHKVLDVIYYCLSKRPIFAMSSSILITHTCSLLHSICCCWDDGLYIWFCRITTQKSNVHKSFQPYHISYQLRRTLRIMSRNKMPNDDDEFEQSKKRIYTLRFGNLKTDMFYKQLCILKISLE